MMSRGLFGWSPPHIQPLTPVSEVSEPPESPSPYLDSTSKPVQLKDDEEEIEPPPAAVPFLRLFACADGFYWVLMVVGLLAATAHGSTLVVYLNFLMNIIDLMSVKESGDGNQEVYEQFGKHALQIIYIAVGVFVAAWIEVSCWILTGER